MPTKKTAKPRAKRAKEPAKKGEKKSVTQRMVDVLREKFKNEEAASTLGGAGLSSVKEVLPTRLEVIDAHVVGIGGLPYGRIVEISGAEDVGKSSLTNHLMWAAQQDGAIASLGDGERKVQVNWVDVFKVDRNAVLLLPANTIEEWLTAINTTLRKFGRQHKLAFFLDSVATTLPKKALEEDLRDSEIPGAAAAAWSRGLRHLAKLLSDRLAVVVLINQLRSKIGVMYGPTEESSGGRAIKHYASVRLELNHGGSHKAGAATIGKWSSVRATKNHLVSGGNFRSGKILLNYDTGWDDGRSTLRFAKETGAVGRDCRSLGVARVAVGWQPAEDATDVSFDDVQLKERK